MVALPHSLGVGAVLRRREWPAHVTLASNFVVDGSRELLEDVVRRICTDCPPLTIRFGGEALFGPDQDIPVQLVESDRIVALHRRLADALEDMSGFVAEQPAFWRSGYRPHMTHVAGVHTPPGSRQQLRYVAIAELNATRATAWAEISLPEGPAQRETRRS
ncbi:2'-5' RNA ligase family protein [Microbacterium jejuense]|uniref:2'-5' RNA ligase family protein n=1 Tax=Microbacterium jejuense TaxID=1263637 RepID=UPI0031E51BC5